MQYVFFQYKTFKSEILSLNHNKWCWNWEKLTVAPSKIISSFGIKIVKVRKLLYTESKPKIQKMILKTLKVTLLKEILHIIKVHSKHHNFLIPHRARLFSWNDSRRIKCDIFKDKENVTISNREKKKTFLRLSMQLNTHWKWSSKLLQYFLISLKMISKMRQKKRSGKERIRGKQQ